MMMNFCILMVVLQLSAGSLFEKVLFVPLDVILNVTGRKNNAYNEVMDFIAFDIGHLCIDSTESGYCVGPFSCGEGRKVFIDANGKIIKEYLLSPDIQLRYIHEPQYRWLDSGIYYSSDEPKALRYQDGRVEIVDNPWHPKFIRERFPGLQLEYSYEDGLIPLFRITSDYIYSLNNRKAVLSIYSRKTLKLLKEIRIILPKRFSVVFPDSATIGELDTYFLDLDFVRNLDPLLHVSDKGILFWYNDYYDINQKKFLQIKGDPLGPPLDLLNSGELGGFTYYVRDETVFYIYSTEKGVYVFRYKG